MSPAKVPGRSPDRVETDRILALPIQHPPDPEECEIASIERLNVGAYNSGWRLRPVQVHALREFANCKGAILPIGVGGGKSGTALMIAQQVLGSRAAKKVMLTMPVQLVGSFMRRHVPEWRALVNLPMTIHVFAGRTAFGRANLATSGASGLYIMPYSLLSRPDTLEILEALDPDLIIADEVHYLKKRRSGCTKKVLHYLEKRRDPKNFRPCGFVGMSGTITSKGILDYHHLLAAALGDGMPLPRSESMAFAWSMVLDSGADPPPGLAGNALGPLVRWAGEPDTSITSCRNAYRRRLETCPGVVTSSDDRPAASLRVEDVEVPPPGPALLELWQKVSVGFTTPQNEPIDHAIHVYKWLSELTAGFYNSLVWPEAANVAKARRISVPQAEDLLTRARSHLKAEQAYHKCLREFFKSSPAHLSMPTEVGASIAHYGSRDVGEELAHLWALKQAADFPGRVERKKVPVRVDDFKVRTAVEWAREQRTGLVFAYHEELAEWATEALTAAGLDPLYAPAGEEGAVLVESIGDPLQGGKGDRLVVASLASHGVGRNLQAFDRMLYLQWPRAALLCEQSLGRLHRTGQEADEVVAYALMGDHGDAWDHASRAATLNDTMYDHQTTGLARRLLYCDWTTIPSLLSTSALKRRGMSPEGLDIAGQEKLRALFGLAG